MQEPHDVLTEAEIEALHRLELGIEWLRRGHGHLIQFHHATGHAMDHLDAAERLLRRSGHDDLANALRDEHLPRGVIDSGRWSYDVLESFEEEFLSEVAEFEHEARDELAGGARHVAERRQERNWKDRAKGEDT
jgi:hypothetical protein